MTPLTNHDELAGHESTSRRLRIQVTNGAGDTAQRQKWCEFTAKRGLEAAHCDPRWLPVFQDGLRHRVYMLDAHENGDLVGVLPLAFVKSILFGRFLVSLPYLNWAGVIASSDAASDALVKRAVELADELDVKYLELRGETPLDHLGLSEPVSTKAQMRLSIDQGLDATWKQLRSVVRTQVRKGDKHRLTVEFGTHDSLDSFYHVFCRNMRDLGTPVYPKRFFREILLNLPEAELCVVRQGDAIVAAALLIHMADTTEIPSASCLKEYRSIAANSWMYWKLIERAVEKGHRSFDFGRSTIDGNTYSFKAKWGAQPKRAAWQYYVRKGGMADLRPENPKYKHAINIWRKLPLAVANFLGPTIVRGIP